MRAFVTLAEKCEADATGDGTDAQRTNNDDGTDDGTVTKPRC